MCTQGAFLEPDPLNGEREGDLNLFFMLMQVSVPRYNSESSTLKGKSKQYRNLLYENRNDELVV